VGEIVGEGVVEGVNVSVGTDVNVGVNVSVAVNASVGVKVSACDATVVAETSGAALDCGLAEEILQASTNIKTGININR